MGEEALPTTDRPGRFGRLRSLAIDTRPLQGFELAQVASTPAIGNVEAGLVASLTSLRFSIVSGGVACVVGAVAIVAAMPSLFRYDARDAAAE